MDIKHLQHHQINKQKWDEAIQNSSNGLVYALSWYLDIVSPAWEALIADDYTLLMPLTIKKKLTINYMYKPVFLQFLGVFGNSISEQQLNQFIQKALQHVKYIDTWFNPQNPLKENQYYTKRQTQSLKLNKPYEELFKNYSRSNTQNLKKAQKVGMQINTQKETATLITLLKDMYSKKGVEGVVKNDYTNLEKIIEYAYQNAIGEFYNITFNNESCSSAFFIKWKNTYTIYFATSELGRQKRSIFLLIDQFIQKHAGENAILDFAGSNIPGVAYMNTGFGGDVYYYYGVKINKLPFPLNKLKK